MAEICRGVVSEGEVSPGCESQSQVARRRRMEIRRFSIVAGVSEPADVELKRQKTETFASASTSTSTFGWERENAVESCVSEDGEESVRDTAGKAVVPICQSSVLAVKALGLSSTSLLKIVTRNVIPRFGFASVCGRRRDMEDAVAAHPSFFRRETGLHYFAVYDGHGCSHVATRCRDRLHELVKEEMPNDALASEAESTTKWKETLERSFSRMDKEVIGRNGGAGNCRCELQTPESETVGSTAVTAILTPEKIIVANCGDSRAVLCRNGMAVPLSSDHKPDRPDELNRIQEAGGRVIYWDGPRVLGVLAMSRAIGDSYLKPYVSAEPEVTVTNRAANDDCLILASDGLWDVVSNDTACGVARMCLKGRAPTPAESAEPAYPGGGASDKACMDASMLLTKLALARHSTDNVSVVVIDLRKNT